MAQIERTHALFIEAYLLWDDVERRFFSQYELSSTRYHALLHVVQEPGLSLRQLSDFLLCTKGNTTRIVRGLESQGYLERKTDLRDGRALHLYTTPEGAQLLETIQVSYQDFKDQCYAGLNPVQQEAFSSLLSQWNTHLTAQRGWADARCFAAG